MAAKATKNMEQGKEGKRSEALRKQATMSKGRMNQPKGSKDEKKATKSAKWQKLNNTEGMMF
jgi:hypothetical protein